MGGIGLFITSKQPGKLYLGGRILRIAELFVFVYSIYHQDIVMIVATLPKSHLPFLGLTQAGAAISGFETAPKRKGHAA